MIKILVRQRVKITRKEKLMSFFKSSLLEGFEYFSINNTDIAKGKC
jgi:hypothetical protein